MRNNILNLLLLITLYVITNENIVECKKSPSSSSHRRPTSSRSSSSKKRRKSSKSKVLSPYDDEDDEEEDINDDYGEIEEEDGLGFLEEEEEYEEEEDIPPPPPKKRPRRKGSRQSPPPRRRYEEDYDDEYDVEEDYPPRRPPPSRRGRGPPSRSSKRVVPYTNKPQPSSLTRGMTFLRDSLPSPTNLKDTTFSAISSAKATTSKLSKDFYREVKGLTSSELEQVMLKATKPDDSPIKSKHVERLVGVTYQISGRYDIYDAVLRKLWNKMAELDWRTKLKSLYILHRFSADGSPEHQAALKARLRELRRTKDPKRKGNYFNSKILLAKQPSEPPTPYRAFLARYAHYVLLRAQCFSGMFNEIKSKKPLKQEHLQASQLLLKAACACQFQSSEEECETTSIALERVAMDLMGLTSSIASALSTSLKKVDGCSVSEKALVKKWCEFYVESLRPQTKAFVKKASGSLDNYGLFLPSRMSATVSQELLSKGLDFSEDQEDEPEEEEEEEVVEEKVEVKEETIEEDEPEEEDNEEDEEEEYEEEEEYDEEYE